MNANFCNKCLHILTKKLECKPNDCKFDVRYSNGSFTDQAVFNLTMDEVPPDFHICLGCVIDALNKLDPRSKRNTTSVP